MNNDKVIKARRALNDVGLNLPLEELLNFVFDRYDVIVEGLRKHGHPKDVAVFKYVVKELKSEFKDKSSTLDSPEQEKMKN